MKTEKTSKSLVDMPGVVVVEEGVDETGAAPQR